MHFSSASVAYLETSYIPFNDCFAAMTNYDIIITP